MEISRNLTNCKRSEEVVKEAEKKVDDVLWESEDRYRTLVEDMPALICRFLPDGVLTFVNEHYCRYFNKKREELEGYNFFQFIPEKERKRVWEHYTALTPENPVITYEHKVLAPDGTIRWQRWTDRAIFDELGSPVEYQSIGEDITETVKAEEQIKRRLEFEKTISRISSRFVRFSDIDETINTSLGEVGLVSGASRVYLFLFNNDTTKMDNTHEWCADGVSPQIDRLKNLPSAMFPWWMEKLKKPEVIHIRDVSKLPAANAEKEILESQDIKSLLVLPVNIKDKLIGFLGFDDVMETGVWSTEDIALLRVLSEIIGNAFERKRSEEVLLELFSMMSSRSYPNFPLDAQ